MTSVFMFGATGQLALAMVDATAARGLGLTTLSRSNVDLTDTVAIRDAIAHAPDGSIILNAAAYTAVDKAETERELAVQVNTEAPATMAKAHGPAIRFWHRRPRHHERYEQQDRETWVWRAVAKFLRPVEGKDAEAKPATLFGGRP